MFFATFFQQLRFFYAVWGVTNKNEDVPRIVANYISNPARLDDILRQRFYGTDLTWAISDLQEHVEATRIILARNTDDAQAQTENKRSLTRSLARSLAFASVD